MEGTEQIKPLLFLLAQRDSPRLRYVLAWMEEVWDVSISMVQRAEDAPQVHIAYGIDEPSAVLYIPDERLLWEVGTNTRYQFPVVAMEDSAPVQQPVQAGYRRPDPAHHPDSFDVLSAIFFCLSRLEEYHRFKPDAHGRYPATESVLYKNGWLRQPVLDEWLEAMREALAPAIQIPKPHFSFQPTYDIDAAWAYRHKGFFRNAGATLRELTGGKFKALAQRMKAIGGADPHNAYEWLAALHGRHTIQPRYFVLAALRRTRFDKNISPEHPAMRELIKTLGSTGIVGMHPSYFSNSARVFRHELKTLEWAAGKAIAQSRQHFIRFTLPATYRELLAMGITDDWSMGYGSHLGFRAGTGRSFLWYDVEREQVTNVRVHPFCFMDATAHYHERLSRDNAFAALRGMQDALQEAGSTLVTVFHNFSLGTDVVWDGWRAAYAAFVADVVEPGLGAHPPRS